MEKRRARRCAALANCGTWCATTCAIRKPAGTIKIEIASSLITGGRDSFTSLSVFVCLFFKAHRALTRKDVRPQGQHFCQGWGGGGGGRVESRKNKHSDTTDFGVAPPRTFATRHKTQCPIVMAMCSHLCQHKQNAHGARANRQ